MNDNSTFALLDREFFVPLEQRIPTAEYREVVAGVLPAEEWSISAGGVWTHVHPAGWSGTRQGWKLHVSANPANAVEVLARVAAVLRDDPTAWKFASDRTLLYILLSKNWPREGGGKFVTVYPRDEAHFQRLGRALAEATDGLDGPYILSDRRVPGSRVVFYRYGEHVAEMVVDPRGVRVHRIASPTGDAVQDRRTGYYRLPEWVEDPYGAGPVRVVGREEKRITLADRYEVHGALKYTNAGGIYHGKDLETGRGVVIRERRPGTGWIDDAVDSVALLRKEARILRAMDGTGWTPAYVDAFQVWEHHYLAMEAVAGTPLRDHALSRYFRRRGIASPRRLFWGFRRLILELLRGVEAFHARGIILRDLTVGNVLVRPDGSVCFIDFEFAWERGGELPFAARINTPGYASPEQMEGKTPTEADDFHALGAIVVELCCMLAPGLGLNREGVLAAGAMMMDEVGLPRELLAVARGLLEPDPARRWDGAAARRALGEIRASSVPWKAREPGRRGGPTPDALPAPDVAGRAAEVCDEVAAFFEASANAAGTGRLWPASPDAHALNAVCVQLGACGPIELVRRARGAVPDAWLDWVERMASPDLLPPGMYVGLAGVALTLAECGRGEASRRVLLSALDTPLLPHHAGLFSGAAGVGLAALALGERWGDGELRDAATRTGDELAACAERRRQGLAWPGADGMVPSGLASGGAGVSLFLTYLGAATGEARWLELAREALDFELAQVAWGAGYAFWPSIGGTRRKNYRSPHVSFGTAGIGTAAARLYACTGDPVLRGWVEECAETLTFRWTNKLWQDMGYAGWGETLLDVHAATGDARWRVHALRVAEALLAHRVRTRFGTAFAGNGLNRVTSDFGMGTSGIALFLHRLAHGGYRAFFPDHLLPGWPAAPDVAGRAAVGGGVQFAPDDPVLRGDHAPGTGGGGETPRPASLARAKARPRTPA